MKRTLKMAAMVLAVCLRFIPMSGCGAPSADGGSQVILADEDNSAKKKVIRFFAPNRQMSWRS